MLKTTRKISSWLQQLQPNHRDELLLEMKAQDSSDSKVDSLESAIFNAVAWHRTTQGKKILA